MKSDKTPLEVCIEREEHREKIAKVKENLPGEGELALLADLFKTFGDYTRVRILFALFEEEVCVCDLAAALDMTASAVSHQLAVLKRAGLIRSRREGKSVFYTLADGHVHTIIGQGMEHVRE